MLRKLIWKNSNKYQLAGAVVGAIFGMFLLLLALQLFYDAKNLIQSDSDNLFGADILIINKEVDIANTLNSDNSRFSKSELQNIESQSFVKKVGPFVAGNYQLTVNIYKSRDDSKPLVNTDLFFESVDDELIDIDKNVWGWSPNSEFIVDEKKNNSNKQHYEWKDFESFVPLVIPSDWINLYNFGYAPSQGEAQISKDLLKKAFVEIVIRVDNQRYRLQGRIVGFSDRINSFVVPMNFMNWANEKFGEGEVANPTRVIIVSEDISNPKLLSFLDENNYETKKDNLKTSKLNLLLRVTMGIMGGISGIIIFLAILIFILSFQLLIVKSREEIRLLIHLGYHPFTIEKFLGKYLLIMSGIIGLVSIIAVFAIKLIIAGNISDYGFNLEAGLYLPVYFAGFVLLIILFLINMFNIRKSIRNYA
ncbi:MAG: hypothetical protein JXR58_13800 [Bacteroidales bacterium]|nr:hypothetical protein [Bacteroidales bacterium]